MEPHQLPTLPAGTHLIHVGPTKTGSTTLQNALFARQDALADFDVLYPGSRAKQQRPLAQVAGWSLALGTREHDLEESTLVDRQIAEAGERRVVLSSERLGRSGRKEARLVLGHFGGERPHVVAVARRYDKYLPSEWQQNVKQLETRSYDAWLRLVLGPDQPDDYNWRFVWRAHDTVGLADRWGGLVGLENTTILVANETDRDALMVAFERMLGLPDRFLSDAPVARTNRSYGYQEIELLRRWSAAFDREGITSEQKLAFIRQVARRLEKIPASGAPDRLPPLPAWARDAVVERSEQRIAGLRALQEQGLRVVGDLDSLRVPEDAFGAGEDLALPRFDADQVERLLTAIADSTHQAVQEQEEAHQRTVRKLRRRAARSDDGAGQSGERPLRLRIADRIRRR